MKDVDKYLQESIKASIKALADGGMPAELIKRMLASARPLGDVEYVAKKMEITDYDEFQEFFSESRKHGLDGSVDYAIGGSTIASILGISPYVTPLDTYMEMLSIPHAVKEDDTKETIFYAGHQIEPIYRNYFRYQFGDRYIVFDHDLQWNSKRFPHFIANVDGLIYDKETGQLGILEIKHTSYRNRHMQDIFQDGGVPEYYDCQGRGYMECLDADFVCFFLGWGNRPTDDDTAMVRVERDRKTGMTIMSACEDFIEENIKERIPPTYNSIKDKTFAKEKIAEIYGKVDYGKDEITFDDDLAAYIPKLMEAKSLVDAKKKEISEKNKELKVCENKYEEMQIPFLEALKTAAYGKIRIEDATYYVSYDTKRAVNLEKLMAEEPAVYEEVRKPAIDTDLLKKKFPELHRKYSEKKVDGKRSFDVREYRRM